MHGQIRKTSTYTEIEKVENINKKAHVVQIYTAKEYIVHDRFCAECNDWQQTNSRYFFTNYCCPECGTRWE